MSYLAISCGRLRAIEVEDDLLLNFLLGEDLAVLEKKSLEPFDDGWGGAQLLNKRGVVDGRDWGRSDRGR